MEKQLNMAPATGIFDQTKKSSNMARAPGIFDQLKMARPVVVIVPSLLTLMLMLLTGMAVFLRPVSKDSAVSGPVSGLSTAGVESHSANVTWQAPHDPRGTIRGYFVEVALQDSAECFHFQIACNGCAQLPHIERTANCSLRDENIFGSDNVSILELQDLKPYRFYMVTVQAVNERGLGEPASLTFRTQISAPNDIIDLTVNSVRNEISRKVDLHITWTPGEQTGPTDYYILVQEALGLDTDAYNQSVSPLTVTGYSNTNYVKHNVLAYWNYNVAVWAHTAKGNSSLKYALNRTVENDSGPVKNLNVAQDPTIANIVTLTFECPELRSRNGRIEKFVISQTLLNPQAHEVKDNIYNQSATEGQLQACSQSYTVTARNIIVERKYSFTVMAVNNKYDGSLSTVSNFEVPAQVPRPEMLKQLLQVDFLVKQHKISTEQTKITTVVCSSCLTDARWGSVRNVGLLVCVKGSLSCTQPGRQKSYTALQFGQFSNWATAKQQGFNTVYRTTPDKWMPPVSGTGRFNKFVIGEDTSCNAADLRDYCNGPLPAGQEFYISVIMCTSAGCSVYTETSIFTTSAPDKPSSQPGVVVGGVHGRLALAAGIAAAIVFLI